MGTTSGWRNVEYAVSHSRCIVALSISAPTYGTNTDAASSAYEPDVTGPRVGQVSGTYKPPSLAKPARTTSAKPKTGAAPRVETYFMKTIRR